MKKHILLLLSMLLIGSTSLLKAQTEVLHFYDDFESATLTYWTTIDADGDGRCWGITYDDDEYYNYVAYSASYKFEREQPAPRRLCCHRRRLYCEIC